MILIYSLSFFDEAWAKDFNAQIKKMASIANIKNLIYIKHLNAAS